MGEFGSKPSEKEWTLVSSPRLFAGETRVVKGPALEPGERVRVAPVEEIRRDAIQDLAAALNDADVDDTGLNWRARMDVIQSVLGSSGRPEKETG